jgi:hypothetical protein
MLSFKLDLLKCNLMTWRLTIHCTLVVRNALIGSVQ